MVYITEAHAKDEWPMGKTVCYLQPKTFEERLKIAKDFLEQKQLRWPITVDGITNAFQDAYAAWPERLYIVEGKKMVYIGQPGPYGFIVSEVEQWLKRRFE